MSEISLVGMIIGAGIIMGLAIIVCTTFRLIERSLDAEQRRFDAERDKVERREYEPYDPR